MVRILFHFAFCNNLLHPELIVVVVQIFIIFIISDRRYILMKELKKIQFHKFSDLAMYKVNITIYKNTFR